MEAGSNDYILLVQDLQCMQMVHVAFTDRSVIRSQLSEQFIRTRWRWFGVRTARGVSFSIKKKERFVILGDRRGSNAIIETIVNA